MSIVHIGCGAGFGGDRYDAAGPVIADLATRGGPRFLIFECLAERTLALAQGQRDGPRWSPLLERYLAPHLADALAAGVRIVTNLGGGDPLGAARRVRALAAEQGLAPPRVAALTGDDLRAAMPDEAIRALAPFDGAELLSRPILAANAYLGAGPVAAAVATGADVILVGRTTDSALVLGPLIEAHGWAPDALDLMAAGTLAGHLLECGAQITGAYFADPGFKDVPGFAEVGFPIAEIDAAGGIVVGKAAATGGCVTRATVTEQILYEMHDPARYLVPDCTLDVTEVALAEAGADRIAVSGARGREPPETLKVTVCLDDGWQGEAEILYAGPNALARARLAGETIAARLGRENLAPALDLIGAGAAHDRGDWARTLARADLPTGGEWRLRAAIHAPDRAGAERVLEEMTALYCSGPAGGGGVRGGATPQVATASVLVPRGALAPRVTLIDDAGEHVREVPA